MPTFGLLLHKWGKKWRVLMNRCCPLFLWQKTDSLQSKVTTLTTELWTQLRKCSSHCHDLLGLPDPRVCKDCDCRVLRIPQYTVTQRSEILGISLLQITTKLLLVKKTIHTHTRHYKITTSKANVYIYIARVNQICIYYKLLQNSS